ncbi:MAG: cation:proton antiporter [bacterium]|nr:cation:proton antiporter [bacterium]
MNTIASIGTVLIGGLVAEKFVNRFNIPAISSYILLGILIGPHIFDLLSPSLIGSTELLSNIVLSFIAFHIGRNFSITNFREIGTPVLFISAGESLLASIFVVGGVYFFAGQPFYISILYGALAAATAPAATMMIVRQYKASGKFTDTMLGIVAIDDAWGIILFSLCLSFAHAMDPGSVSELNVYLIFIKSSGEVFFSILLGVLLAFIIRRSPGYIKLKGDILTFVLGAVLVNTGIAIWLGLSPLLSNITLGAALVNIDKEAFRYFDSIKSIDWPLYIIFYVLAGASMDVSLVLSIGLIGLVYIFFRVIGKVAGAYIGSTAAMAPVEMKKYMGLALLPQAGVALGLAIIARNSFPQIGQTIFTTIAATTIIYEVFGPIATRYALIKAGQIGRQL